MKNKYYQVVTEGRTATVNIYGTITSWPWKQLGEKSADNIKSEIDGLDVDTINVCINSMGGEVAEALAIYHALQRHKANVHTYCDGFACSAASIVFCAGDERTMGKLALLMIHNCMVHPGFANADELRKAADDADKINQSSIKAYLSVTNLSEEKIREMMDAQTWITAEEAVSFGFATEISGDDDNIETATQSAFPAIRQMILSGREEKEKEPEPEITAPETTAQKAAKIFGALLQEV